MCMAIPMKVTEISGADGKCELSGVSRSVRFDLVPSVKIGDYVLVHAGFAIETIDEDEAQRTLELFKEMLGGEEAPAS